MTQDPQAPLRAFERRHEFFVGIDSDGCTFDTMEIKQKECFIPNIVLHWDLQAISKYVRETAEFVNLYSAYRGTNRFPALLKTFDLLSDREVVRRRGVPMPEAGSLRDWVKRETRLGNPALRQAVEATGDPVLRRTLDWSEEVNRCVARLVRGVPPFPGVRESLERLSTAADLIVVSATPGEALLREWEEHGLDRYARVIAGQEMGKKSEHIALAAGGRYAPEKILMVGDAPGDLKAARANGALFYPIEPGREEASWDRFLREALDLFFEGRYAGDYERQRIAAFEALLPKTPPWEVAGRE